MISIHAYVVEALKKLSTPELELVERATHIPKETLRKIRGGWIKNPGVKGVETLARYFKRLEAKSLRRRKAA